VAYIFTFGDIPDHLEACHTCDNPICANPHHIFLGTHKENLHDAIKKGRKAILRGEQIATKLTSDKVIQIRKLFFNGECTLQEIADRYGICKGYTWNVVHGLFWKHIT
jgi:hypothetical protein